MSIYKRGKIYWYKFCFDGQSIRESTKQGNDKIARKMEAVHRTRLAEGLVGIREKKPAPVLRAFLENEFRPYVETKHKEKPGTIEYYEDGVKMLLKSDLASLRLDEITDQDAQRFAGKLAHLSASRINCGLRTLRKALNLALAWGKMQTKNKIELAKGERMRERVVTDSGMKAYLASCPQPWRDAATIIRGSGACPGEVFALRWTNVLLNAHGGLIMITDGKTKFRKRMLPMVPEVYAVLKDRWESAGRPSEGWIFPSGSQSGHFDKDSAKDQHSKALRDSGVTRFEPYCLRHTALTRLAESGCDAFTLQRIAGHSNIQTTMRYVHPQAEAIEMAFQRVQGQLTGHKIGHSDEN